MIIEGWIIEVLLYIHTIVTDHFLSSGHTFSQKLDYLLKPLVTLVLD